MFDSVFGIHERAVEIRRDRSEVLANNLANSDTPNYKARDIDFRKAINDSISSQEKGFRTDMNLTNSRHIEGFGEMSTASFLKYRMPTQPSLDGNTVESHIEKAKFTENAMQHQATLEFIDSKIKKIDQALRGN